MLQIGRVLFFTQSDKTDLFTRLMQQSGLLSTGFEALIHAPSVQLAHEFHTQLQTWMAEFIAYCRTCINTLIINGRRTAENIARNLPWYVATPSLSRLKDRYKHSPAIIVSAGPSLRKNKHLLQRCPRQGRHHRGADDASAAAGDGRRAAVRDIARLPRHLHALLRDSCPRRCEPSSWPSPRPAARSSI